MWMALAPLMPGIALSFHVSRASTSPGQSQFARCSHMLKLLHQMAKFRRCYPPKAMINEDDVSAFFVTVRTQAHENRRIRRSTGYHSCDVGVVRPCRDVRESSKRCFRTRTQEVICTDVVIVKHREIGGIVAFMSYVVLLQSQVNTDKITEAFCPWVHLLSQKTASESPDRDEDNREANGKCGEQHQEEFTMIPHNSLLGRLIRAIRVVSRHSTNAFHISARVGKGLCRKPSSATGYASRISVLLSRLSCTPAHRQALLSAPMSLSNRPIAHKPIQIQPTSFPNRITVQPP